MTWTVCKAFILVVVIASPILLLCVMVPVYKECLVYEVMLRSIMLMNIYFSYYNDNKLSLHVNYSSVMNAINKIS